MRTDAEVDAMREAHRVASDRIGDTPAASVRAAVLAAASRGVDARPRMMTRARPMDPSGPVPIQRRRWPLATAATLVVGVMTGLIATLVMRESPERITTVASSAPSPLADKTDAPTEESMSRTMPALPARAPSRPPGERTSIGAGAARSKPAPQRAVEPQAPAAAPSIEAQSGAIANTEEATAGASPGAGSNAQAVGTRERDAEAQGLRAPMAPDAARTRVGRAVEPETPEAWIERIVKLRADGNDIEADRELDAVRRRYPDFRIPVHALRAAGTR